MTPELEQAIVRRWPEWFRSTGQPEFTCGDGWFQLIWNLMKDLQLLVPGTGFHIVQVKQKFGELRFYVENAGYNFEDIRVRIVRAEQDSSHICEVCGAPGRLRRELNWMTTLCEYHYLQHVPFAWLDGSEDDLEALKILINLEAFHVSLDDHFARHWLWRIGTRIRRHLKVVPVLDEDPVPSKESVSV